MSAQEVSGQGEKSKTLERILGAALEEFAEHGYAGARTERIARRASVNKAALYYHVGGKPALYDTVVRDCFSAMLTSLARELDGISSPQERLDAFISVLTAKVLGSAPFAQIMLCELGRGAASIHQEVSGCISSIHEIYMDILSNGREVGMFRKEQDPMPGFAMILGGLLFLRSRKGGPATGFSYQSAVRGPSSADIAEGMTTILNSAIRLHQG